MRKKQQISLLFRSGTSLRGDFIKMIYADLKPEHGDLCDVPAILFAVSKKNVPSAVRRNRVKRMMREAYRLEKSSEKGVGKESAGGSEGTRRCLVFLYTTRNRDIPGLHAFRAEIARLIEGADGC